MQGLASAAASPLSCRRRREEDDAGASVASEGGSDSDSDVENDEIVMGPDGIGYESSGLASDESDLQFRDCESRSCSEGEEAAASVASEATEDSEDNEDPELRCWNCEGEMEERGDTEFEGMCDGGCRRPLPRTELTLSCKDEDCEFDICLPCAENYLSPHRSTSGAPHRTAPGRGLPAVHAQFAAGTAPAPLAPAPTTIQQQLAGIAERIRGRSRAALGQSSREVAFVDWAAGADVGAVRRAARKFIYRTFVAAQYGYLGHGVCIRIPDCVVAAIRWRFPNPGCNCELSAIGTCQAHGYTWAIVTHECVLAPTPSYSISQITDTVLYSCTIGRGGGRSRGSRLYRDDTT